MSFDFPTVALPKTTIVNFLFVAAPKVPEPLGQVVAFPGSFCPVVLSGTSVGFSGSLCPGAFAGRCADF